MSDRQRTKNDAGKAAIEAETIEENYAIRHESETSDSTVHGGSPDADDEPWPEPIHVAALYGIAGEFVRMVDPITEADRAAVLIQFLVAFGALVGRSPFYRVEATRHHANLFACLVGDTSKARKGTAWDRVRKLYESIDGWKPHVSGLSSGEGLKYHVRDAVEGKERNEMRELVTKITDPGVQDKRLLVYESEFASVLRAVQRQGNTLSATVREAWDSGNLRTLTKNDPITATGAHVSIICHVTATELRSELSQTDTANGFANRFLFAAVRRSKELPFGGDDFDDAELHALIARLRDRADSARTRGLMTMTKAARMLWRNEYHELSAARDGLHGAVTARSEAQAIRLALVYALLDGADQIDVLHLVAALHAWRYCDATAMHVFGVTLGDKFADAILKPLRQAGSIGMTRTEINRLFAGNAQAGKIQTALDLLVTKHLAICELQPTAGRSIERWKATT